MGRLGGRVRRSGRGELDDQGQVIRADIRAKATLHDGKAVENEGMVDRQPVRSVARPAPLTAETEPRVAQAADLEEVLKMSRSVGGVEVANDDLRAAMGPDEDSDRGEFGKAGAHA